MTDEYDPVISYETHVTQAESRIFQKRKGDINGCVHDEQFKRLFQLNVDTFLPGQILNTLAAHRSLYYAKKYLSMTKDPPESLNVETISLNLKDGINIENGQTPEILLRTFVDYTKPTIWAHNNFMLAGDYAQKADVSEKNQKTAIDEILKCYCEVGLSIKLDSDKFDPDNCKEGILEYGKMNIDWQGDNDYYNILEQICGCEIDRQAHVPLYLAANFAGVFMDLLAHPGKAGNYQQYFEEIKDKVGFMSVTVDELASLLNDSPDKEEFLSISPLYQFEDKIWLPGKFLPFYNGQQNIRMFREIEEVYKGQPCDIYIHSVTRDRKGKYFKLIFGGTISNGRGNRWQVFQSEINLGFIGLKRSTGFANLISRIEASRESTKDTEDK